MVTRKHQHPTITHLLFSGYILGALMLITGVAMLLPVICAAIYSGEGDFSYLLSTATFSILTGYPLWKFCERDRELGTRDAFFIATAGWVIISAISALPFVMSGAIPSFTDAFFEMMSGYTTTGATILVDIESLPHGLMLWRSQTHFIGGMGFITLAVLLLPRGVGGVRLNRAETSPGQVVTGERFTARTKDAMVLLWGIYLALNLMQIVLMYYAGLSLFDSICHTFATVATAGFSTYNASIGHFDSALVDWITITFMTLGGINFVLFIQLIRGNFIAFRINTELRYYLLLLLLISLFVSATLYFSETYLDDQNQPDIADSIRHGTFQVVSLLTTTGFTTADYAIWPNAAQMTLWVVVFIGACAGSTTSGVKIIHYILIWRFMAAAVKKLFFQPLSVISVRVNEQRVNNRVVYLALCYFIANIFIILFGSIVMAISDDLDVQSALSTVISSLMNIGPGFGAIGPTETYYPLSDFGKWYLSLNMLIGRLEMFSALVLFYPSFWRD